MDRRTFLAGAASLTAVGLAGCMRSGSADGDDEGDYDIGMGSGFFRPHSLAVEVGTTVVWRNTGSRRHTVTAYDSGVPADAEFFASGGFDSEQAARDGWMNGFEGRIEPGADYEHTFEVPGTYDYFCVPHEPSMVGRIEVTE